MPRGPNPMRRKLRQNEFYCVMHNKSVTIPKSEICVRVASNGQPMLKGYCSKYDCYLYKFIGKDKLAKMRQKYGKC